MFGGLRWGIGGEPQICGKVWGGGLVWWDMLGLPVVELDSMCNL